MRAILALLTLAVAITPAFASSRQNLKCVKEVTREIEGKDMFNVVEKVHSKDGKDYVVVFRTASGDAEQASLAVVTVNPSDCSIENVRYVRGSH